MANPTQSDKKTETLSPSALTDKALIRRLWKLYIWPQRRTLFMAIMFMVLLAGATAAYTYVVSFIVNQANMLTNESATGIQQATRYAKAILPVLLGITILSGVSNYLQRILTNKISLNTVGGLQKDMFASTHAADFEVFSREPIGNLISKFTNDVTVLSNALIRALSNLIKELLTVILTVAAMLHQNWQLTLMVLLLYPLAFWPILTISKRLRGNAKDVQEHVGKITSDLKESFSGARMVKTYGLENYETKRLGHTFDERIRLFLKLVTEQARVDPILEVMGGLAIAGVVIFGVYQVTDGAATAGSIAGVLTGLLVLSPRIRALGTLNTVIQEGLSALERMFAVIDQRPTLQTSTLAETEPSIELQNPTGRLEFKNVSFSYPDGTQALTNISFAVKPGETVAFVGASGGGKSTIINLIPRLYDVTSGQILFDNQNIKALTLASLRRSMALVSQSVTLFDDTIANNIRFGDLAASEAEIIDAAKAADAHDFISALADGYHTRLGEDGDSLSGGQRQRLSIARAILRDAPLLLLDEATSALDADSESNVQAALERLSNGRTTLIIAHKLSTVQNADRIYVLDKGEIKESGTPQMLSKKRGGIYARLKSLQS